MLCTCAYAPNNNRLSYACVHLYDFMKGGPTNEIIMNSHTAERNEMAGCDDKNGNQIY